MIYEVEIKTSTSDLKLDFKKKIKKHNTINHKVGEIPNFFYFLIPEKSFGKVDIPIDYGIMVFTDNGRIITKRKATRIHSGKTDLNRVVKIAKSFYYKYWKSRTGEEEIFNIRKNKSRKS